MRNEAVLPPECEPIKNKIRYVRQVGREEYSSSCPNCAGTIHRDGTWPDRFRIFLHSRTTGSLLAWCRSCGFTWWPGKTGRGNEWTPEQKEAWIAERRAAEQRRMDEIKGALRILEQEHAWINYHKRLNETARALYLQRRIDGYWLDYWKLGYCDAKQVWSDTDKTPYFSPSLTIPVHATGGAVVNVRHRLLHPEDPRDKYRPEFKGLPPALYICDYERPLSGRVLLVEGEFKAMTTYIELDDPALHVVGIPGKSPDSELLDQLADCEPVYVCLDPDAFTARRGYGGGGVPAVTRLAGLLGKRARIVRLPGKIDDMILAGSLKRADISMLMRTARKTEG